MQQEQKNQDESQSFQTVQEKVRLGSKQVQKGSLQAKWNGRPIELVKSKQMPVQAKQKPIQRQGGKKGIQQKETPLGKVWVYVVAKGDYPIKVADACYLRDIYELAKLQHPIVIQKLGLTQRGYFDYNELLSIKRSDLNFEYWIQGFAEKWIIHENDELLIQKLPGLSLPEEKKEEEEKKPKSPKYRKATDHENWLKRNVSPDELDRIWDALGDGARYDALQHILKKLGAKDRYDMARIIYEQAQKENYPGGTANPLHPLNHSGLYTPSKNYPGLYTQDEVHLYYGTSQKVYQVQESELKNGNWKKYRAPHLLKK